jgi:hypothetical protein
VTDIHYSGIPPGDPGEIPHETGKGKWWQNLKERFHGFGDELVDLFGVILISSLASFIVSLLSQKSGGECGFFKLFGDEGLVYGCVSMISIFICSRKNEIKKILMILNFSLTIVGIIAYIYLKIDIPTPMLVSEHDRRAFVVMYYAITITLYLINLVSCHLFSKEGRKF